MEPKSRPTSSAGSPMRYSTKSGSGRTGRLIRCIRWSFSTRCGSKSGTKASSRTRPSMWHLRSIQTAKRTFSGFGSNTPKAPNSGSRWSTSSRLVASTTSSLRSSTGSKAFPGDHVGVSADHRADLHRAPDPEQPGVRVLEGPQGDPARHQGDLPGRERRYGAGSARGVRGRMGQALSGDRPGVAKSLGPCRAVLRVRPRHPQDDLHHQRGRGAASLAAQDHQDPRQLSHRRCGAEAAVSRDQECRPALAARNRMDGRHEPVCHSVWRTLSGNGTKMRTTDTTATPMIAWPAPSPSSPAPSARRYAALGLDCSVRPSKLAHRAADASCSMYGNVKSTFTEISYTKLLTFPGLNVASGSLSSSLS